MVQGPTSAGAACPSSVISTAPPPSASVLLIRAVQPAPPQSLGSSTLPYPERPVSGRGASLPAVPLLDLVIRRPAAAGPQCDGHPMRAAGASHGMGSTILP